MGARHVTLAAQTIVTLHVTIHAVVHARELVREVAATAVVMAAVPAQAVTAVLVVREVKRVIVVAATVPDRVSLPAAPAQAVMGQNQAEILVKGNYNMQIKIDEKLSDYIESLQYEKDRTNEIVAFMLAHDYDTCTEAFRQWDHENQEAFVKYQEARNELENRYIRSRPEFQDNQRIRWSLNFATKTLTAEAAHAEKD